MVSSTPQDHGRTASIDSEHTTLPSRDGPQNSHLRRQQESSKSLPMPPVNQVVLLGFVAHGKDAQKAIYGPPGASHDSLGNVYFDLDNGRKQWIGSYRDGSGKLKQPPKYWLDACCCIQ
jgi:hypothetical protein